MAASRLSRACLVWMLVIVATGCPGLAAAFDDRLECAVVARSLGYWDLREPKSFTPSSGLVPEYGGWTRDWTERRAYARLGWRLVDAPHLLLVPGLHLGVAQGRFTARNVAIGYYESWETRPAFLWGPRLRLVWRRAPQQGAFLLLRYALFFANAPEGREDVASRTGTATPPSLRDAVFSWRSHEVTAAVGYDWGRVSLSAGLMLTAFHLDKRLTHHIDPTGATGNALAAILALDAQTSRYAYEPRTLVAPYLSFRLRPGAGCSLEASLRPAAQPDIALSASLSF